MKFKFHRQTQPSRQLGDHRNEWAAKHRKLVLNFAQSRDVHENRCIRQARLARRRTPSHGR